MSRLNATLVTVLIPTYNRAHFLPDAINSALAQTHQSLEILILDDASPDSTAEVVARYRDEPRVHHIRHNTNRGIAGNWHYGIGAAQGEFFCLLHDDDVLDPEFVSTLVAPMVEDPSVALVFCDHAMMDAQGTPQTDARASERFHRNRLTAGLISAEMFARAVLVDYSIPVGATLFRGSAVNPRFIDERAKGAIDYWLLYQVLKTGKRALYVDQKLMTYRAHAGGMSTTSALFMGEGHLFRLDAILCDPSFATWRRQIATQRRFSLISCGIELTQAGRASEARQYLWTALCERLSLRATVPFLLSYAGSVGRSLIARLRARR